MRRREFLGAAAAALLPRRALAQAPAARFADMHSHLMLRQGLSRDALVRQGMLVVAEKVIPDYPLIRFVGNRMAAQRDASSGEMRGSFEGQWARARAAARSAGLAGIISVETLDRVVKDGTPGIALASEGADFLEGDLKYLEQKRAEGLVHLQLVHYRISDVGDISTEEPVHGGLTAFGKDVVRHCNRLGILVDVAHGSVAGMEQTLELSSKPVIYSHGFVSNEQPRPGARNARGIHMPLAKRIADKGGVVGVWPLGSMFSDREAYADGLVRTVAALGARHVGIGSDINGLRSTVLPTHDEFGELAGLLEKRGLNAADVDGVLGGNYIRVLREAINV